MISGCTRLATLLILLPSLFAPVLTAQSDRAGIELPTGQTITPLAAKGSVFETLNPHLPGRPDYEAGQASALALSPDQRTLVVLTSGYNRVNDLQGKLVPEASNEYAFVYDVSGDKPVQKQAIQIPNTLFSIAWATFGDRFFVSGGVDDVVYEYSGATASYTLTRSFHLGHKEGLGIKAPPGVSGLAVSPDGQKLLAANYQNDSVTLIDLKTGRIIAERDLRPSSNRAAKPGTPGGIFPRALIWLNNRKAYVASQRDREVIELVVNGTGLITGTRVKTPGQPVAFVRNGKGTRVYVALDNTDGIAVLDPVQERLVETIPTVAPMRVWPNTKKLGGAGTNALALSPEGRTLVVSNAGENAIATVGFNARAAGVISKKSREPEERERTEKSAVLGLIPAGWYPTGVAVRTDGRLFVVNA